MRARVRSLERLLDEERVARTEERRRHDTPMAQLMQRIPELEAAQRPEQPRQESPESRSDSESTHVGQERAFADEESPRRSWWRRLFGLE